MLVSNAVYHVSSIVVVRSLAGPCACPIFGLWNSSPPAKMLLTTNMLVTMSSRTSVRRGPCRRLVGRVVMIGGVPVGFTVGLLTRFRAMTYRTSTNTRRTKAHSLIRCSTIDIAMRRTGGQLLPRRHSVAQEPEPFFATLLVRMGDSVTLSAHGRYGAATTCSAALAGCSSRCGSPGAGRARCSSCNLLRASPMMWYLAQLIGGHRTTF